MTLFTGGCVTTEDILNQASPYLFPCVLEYSLLAAAVMFSMYSDVGILSRGSGNSDNNNGDKDKEQSHLNSLVTEINFHRSHKGMFAGVMVLAATVVSIVLFYSYSAETIDIASVIYHSTMIALYSLILFGTCIAIIQLQKMKFNRNLTSSVDDVMLVVAMGGLFFFQVLKLIPLISHMTGGSFTTQNSLQLTESWLELAVACLHTWFLIDGMRRMTNTEEQFYRKPGRGAVMFLLLTNVALWLYRTFHMKEIEVNASLQEKEYGYLAWQLIMHALVPLLIFYHFHCSACLAHMWSGAYVPVPVKPPPKHINPQPNRTPVPSSTSSSCNSSIANELYINSGRPKHRASDDLVPDRIIQFSRHGKAPEAHRGSVNTVVESVESPADSGRSVTWPRLDGGILTSNGGTKIGKGVTLSVSKDSLVGDSRPSITWQDDAERKVVQWQVQPHSDNEEDA